MLDERSKRRPSHTEGPEIMLADGQKWLLAETPPEMLREPDFQALLVGLLEAEDRSDQLRAELALAIALLTRNHHLEPNQIQELLGFPRNSPELARFQADMHAVAISILRDSSQSGSQPRNEE